MVHVLEIHELRILKLLIHKTVRGKDIHIVLHASTAVENGCKSNMQLCLSTKREKG